MVANFSVLLPKSCWIFWSKGDGISWYSAGWCTVWGKRRTNRIKLPMMHFDLRFLTNGSTSKISVCSAIDLHLLLSLPEAWDSDFCIDLFSCWSKDLPPTLSASLRLMQSCHVSYAYVYMWNADVKYVEKTCKTMNRVSWCMFIFGCQLLTQV